MTDRIRMRYMGMGAAWINVRRSRRDEGNARLLADTKRAQEHDLSAVPGHHLDGDNRLGPGHARKLASRLLLDTGAPVYFLKDEEGGHGVNDGFRNPELMALRMTFLIDVLVSAGKSTH
ncbi:hypothetical protein [Stenotrophomonas sp.]|uniref:hypothetical protein n=1 Tax=Stenotrophomonas sp. TaxID=69392 RepID=UPI0028AC961D|nr:hypothetical protein [Stenotrophomonas sp.]